MPSPAPSPPGASVPHGVAAMLCPNIPAFATVFHGLLRAGATVTTVNSLYTADEIASQLTDAGATWLFTVSALLPGAREAAERPGFPPSGSWCSTAPTATLRCGDLLTAGAPAPDVTFDPATHVAVLPYSSGTTGRPKGVMLSHRNLVANVEQARGLLGVAPDDRLLALLPFFHIYGLTVLLNLALRERASLVTMPAVRPRRVPRGSSRTTGAATCSSPRRWRWRWPSTRWWTSTISARSTPCCPARRRWTASWAPDWPSASDCRVLQGYGMTEMSPVSHLIPRDATDVPVSSVGYTVPNMECRLVDPATGEDIDVPAEGTSAPGPPAVPRAPM